MPADPPTHSRTAWPWGQILLPVLLLFLLAPTPSGAGAADKIYKRVLPDGSVVFTDEPSPDAEVVELPPLQTIPAPPLAIVPETTAEKKPPPIDYDWLRITFPADDMPVRENSGRLEVTVEMDPPLQRGAGHRLVLKLDGRIVASILTGNRFVLENVDRGTHELVAEIQDPQGRPLKTSPPVTFHMLRVSRLLPPRAGN